MYVPPPYKAIRPVRLKLCFSGPTFSTACWAMTSPVAKSTCARPIDSSDQYYYTQQNRMKLVVMIRNCIDGIRVKDNTDGGSDALCEEGLAREFGLIPVNCGVIRVGRLEAIERGGSEERTFAYHRNMLKAM